ncbi:MAG: LemA family protein [Candidatus Omnitrophica bacterium]|nr:LemA family protein [Candidatus Omnitrophota bacterium]
MKKGYIVFLVAVAILFSAYQAFKFQYNRLVLLDQKVQESWSQIENVLQRRNDLIPNLVETVKGYAKHEKELFLEVTEARSRWAGAKTVKEKEAAAGGISGVLSRLLLVAENYPELKASGNFLSLQDELAGAENRIAVERKRYNESVNGYNSIAKSFPAILFVRLFKFDGEKEYFQSVEGSSIPPAVQF